MVFSRRRDVAVYGYSSDGMVYRVLQTSLLPVDAGVYGDIIGLARLNCV